MSLICAGMVDIIQLLRCSQYSDEVMLILCW